MDKPYEREQIDQEYFYYISLDQFDMYLKRHYKYAFACALIQCMFMTTV